MKRARPSGAQQRKLKKEKLKALQGSTGSMLKYMKGPSGPEQQPTLAPMETAEDVRPGTSAAGEVETSGGAAGEEAELSDSESSSSEEESPVEEEEEEDPAFSDIAAWPLPVPDDLRQRLVRMGSESLQNKYGPFPRPKQHGGKTQGDQDRSCPYWFYKVSRTDWKTLRTWKVYSKSTGLLYCFCCRLFAEEATEDPERPSPFITGFNNGWELNPSIAEHAASEAHLSCFGKWRVLEMRLGATPGAARQWSEDKERSIWREGLDRLLCVILHLAQQNLPFDAPKEVGNRGHFLATVKLLSKFDAVLMEHWLNLKGVVPSGPRKISCLSPRVQNEFILALGKHVKECIVADIKKTAFFAILFDSIPDLSPKDHMSAVIRFVQVKGESVAVKESFLGIFRTDGKTAAELTGAILNRLAADGLDIHLCCGQGYDNAANMTGVHGEIQAKIKDVNPQAIFLPCTNLSLNLCGVHSFETVASSLEFFGNLEDLYAYLSGSTRRWKAMRKATGLTLEPVPETRWSAHYEAVHALQAKFPQVIRTLKKLKSNPKYSTDTQRGAAKLIPALSDFSFLSYLCFWSEVLGEVDRTQKTLGMAGIGLEETAVQLRSLQRFLEQQRMAMVEKAINCATSVCKEMDIATERRIQETVPGEEGGKAGSAWKEGIGRAMLECLGRFQQELHVRSQGMEQIVSVFRVLLPSSLMLEDEDRLWSFVPAFVEVYDEFSGEAIVNEIFRLRYFIRAAEITQEQTAGWTALNFVERIVSWKGEEMWRTLYDCLRVFLAVCVAGAPCERSFAKLELIKSALRATTSNKRLSNLAILSIEREYVKNISFDDVINNFAEMKTRRKRL